MGNGLVERWSSVRSISLLGLGLAVIAHPAPARSAAPAGAPKDMIVVTAPSHRGAALGDPTPIVVLTPDDLRNFEATTIGELLKRLKARTDTSGDDKPPLLLLDGKRVITDAEVYDIPTEAIERIDILPASEAGQYGLAPHDRVLNFIIKRNFKTQLVSLQSGTTSDNGGNAFGGDATYFSIENKGRVNLALKASDTSPVYEPADPQAGGRIDRTFAALNRVFEMNATVLHEIGRNFVATGNATFNVTRVVGFAGLTAQVPLFSPARQASTATTGRVGVTLATRLGRWDASLVTAFDDARTRTRTDIGLLEQTAATGKPAQINTTETTALSAGLHGNGALVSLPTGLLTADIAFDLDDNRSIVSDSFVGPGKASNLARSETTTRINLAAPLLSETLWPHRLGDLSASLGGAIHTVPGFGVLGDASLGLNWTPRPRLAFAIALASESQAPAIQLVASGAVLTPNVQIFDFTTGQTAIAPVVASGNPNLRTVTTRSLTANASLFLLEDRALNLVIAYSRAKSTNQIVEIPVATTALETAFPSAFVRNAAGQLIQVNSRPVNIGSEVKSDLRLGLFWSHTFSNADRAKPAAATTDPTSVSLAFNHSWHLADGLRLPRSSGVEDLLAGASSLSTMGVPAREFDAEFDAAKAGTGLHITARWAGRSRIVGAGSEAVTFSPSFKTSLALFVHANTLLADTPWSRATRLTLTLRNPIGARQHATASSGAAAPGLDAIAHAAQLRAIEFKIRMPL